MAPDLGQEEDPMDWIYAHLVVNHFPIVLASVASAAALVAAVLGREGAWRYSVVTGLLAALAAPVAFLTGKQAEDVAESLPGLAEEAIERHEQWGLYALIALLVAGVLAVVALVRKSTRMRWLFAIGIWAATATTGLTALHGGDIEHDPAARGGPAARPEALGD
jgi:uncharacterized membrane protein